MKKYFFSLAILTVCIAAGAYTDKKPNILFLCMDDLKPELGCYGLDYMITPNMDRLAKSGMLFENHYIQQAVCGPSRASMFSGLRPDTTRVWDLSHTCREECPQAFTMQQYFKEAGYETTGSGKIMHGFKNDDPLSWSIPYLWPGALPYAGGCVPALYQQYQAPRIHDAVKKLEESGLKEYGEQQAFMSGLNAKPSVECLDLPDDAYSDGAMTQWGMQMLDQFAESGKPFFLTLGYRKPHLPFVAPKKYWDLYDREDIELAEFRRLPEGSPEYAWQPGYELAGYSDIEIKELPDDHEKQKELIHGYRACVSYVDTQIGKVLDKLKETGLDKYTIIVLWGDHGWHLGDHNIWCKHSNYEQATRSPLIISIGHGAGRMVRGRVSPTMVESVDIFPTLCELAGLEVPEQLEGISLVPVLTEPVDEVRSFSMSQYPDHWEKDKMGYSMRDQRYRVVFWVDRSVAETGEFDESLIQEIELFDYETDPLETVNQAKNPEYKSVVDQFKKNLEAFFE